MEISNIIKKIEFWRLVSKITTINLPLSFLLLYVFGFIKSNLIFQAISIMTITISIVWWFWAIYAVAFLSIILDRSGKNIKEVIKDFHIVKSDINDLKNSSFNRKR